MTNSTRRHRMTFEPLAGPAELRQRVRDNRGRERSMRGADGLSSERLLSVARSPERTRAGDGRDEEAAGAGERTSERLPSGAPSPEHTREGDGRDAEAADAGESQFERLLNVAPQHAAAILYEPPSTVPIVGPLITAGKRLLHRLGRGYLDRQSAANEYLVALSVELGREQRRTAALLRADLTALQNELREQASGPDPEALQARTEKLRAELDRHSRQLNTQHDQLGRVAELFAIGIDAYVIARRSGRAIPDAEERLGPSPEPFRSSEVVALGDEHGLRPEEPRRAIFERHIDVFRDCRRVLDVGCGNGDFLALLQREGIGGVGVDASPHAVQACRERGLEVIESDVLTYLDGTPPPVDGVMCSHLIEHLPPIAAIQLLQGLARALPPGGPLVILTPNAASLFAHLVHFWRDPTHVRFYPEELLCRMLAATGYTIEASSAEPDMRESYWQL